MISTIDVVEPAKDTDLVTLYAAKIALNLTAGATTTDEQIELFIKWSSAEVAEYCNRVLGQETVVETFHDINACDKLYLSRWPVKVSDDFPLIVTEDDVELTIDVDYEVDLGKGRLRRFDGTWAEPVVVQYTGGFDLPAESPLALQQAAVLLTREAYYAAQRGDASIRSVSHKESRVMYFDPNAQAAKAMAAGASGQGGSPALRSAKALLEKFMRFEA